MFSRSKPPTISLPLFSTPRSPRPYAQQQIQRRNRTRYMALGLFSFLILVTLFAFGKASPLIYNKGTPRSELALQNAAVYKNNMETVKDIYVGSDPSNLENLNHLVIVTGHAILLDKANYKNDEAWVLESFQKGGQVATFIDHILKGIEIAKTDENALLVFSGYSSSKPLH